MFRKKFIILALLCIDFAEAKNIVDCRVMTSGTTECRQYGSKRLLSKEINYDKDRKKLIISKTLPLHEKKTIKVISIADMIEKYVKVEDSLRFKGTKTPPLKIKVLKEPVLKKVITKAIANIYKKNKPSFIKQTQNVVTPSQVKLKEIDTLKSVKPKDTHVLERNLGFYKVVSGDTLSKIAKKLSISSKRLLSYNILTGDRLKAGYKLKVPLFQYMIDSIMNAEYIVQENDTLLSIAYKFKLKVKDLVKFNHIKSNMVIRKGKKLALPLPYVLKKIAQEKKKKLEQKRLAKLNKKNKRTKLLRGFANKKLRVTATAYTSHHNQTDETPFLAAWNNRIRPGMRLIAVSRDLITRYGLRNGTKVRIGGLPGYYVVRDKMNKRYRRRIDIYMGLNKRKALRWGRRSVTIHY